MNVQIADVRKAGSSDFHSLLLSDFLPARTRRTEHASPSLVSCCHSLLRVDCLPSSTPCFVICICFPGAMWLNTSSNPGSAPRAFLVFCLGLLVSLVGAAMSPPEITLACNGLARMSFDLKDLVNLVALKRNPGPFQVTFQPEVLNCAGL